MMIQFGLLSYLSKFSKFYMVSHHNHISVRAEIKTSAEQTKEFRTGKVLHYTLSYLCRKFKKIPHSFRSREVSGAGFSENWGNFERLDIFFVETREVMFNSCGLQIV